MPETLPARRDGAVPARPMSVQASADSLMEYSESLRDFFFVIFRHKALVLVFFLAVVGGALVRILTTPDTFTSHASLLVRQGRESVTVDPTAATGGPIYPVYRDAETIINSELEILRSRELVEDVVRAIGAENILQSAKTDAADPDVDPSALATLALMHDIQIEVKKKSNIINLSYQSRNATVARRVIADLIDRYLAKHINLYRAEGAYDFFAEQTKGLRKKLDEAEVSLRNFKNVFGIGALNAQQNMVIGRLRTIEDQLELRDAQIAASTAKAKVMQAILDGEPVPGRDDSMLIRSDSYKDIQSSLITEETTLASLDAERTELKKQLAKAEKELERLNDSEIRLLQLEREREMLAKKYQSYSENLEQARIDQALETEKISNIGVVQAASKPLEPDASHGLLKLLLAIAVGGFGSLALAFGTEYLDHTLKRPEDVEDKLGLQSLVFVPRLHSPSLIPLTRKERGGKNIEGSREEWGLSSDAVEYFEILRDRVARALTPSLVPPVILGITSCHEGEGVSSVAAGLAVTLARQEDSGRVLFVNANSVSGRGKALFGIKSAPGAAEIAVGSNGRVVATEQAIDPQGPGARPGSAALVVYEGLVPFIRKHDYNFVVFDMPPLSQGRSTVQLASSMDGTILVVEAEKMRWEIAQRAKAVLEEADTNLLGAVLNKRRFHVPRWLYNLL